ncbi:MAG: hypothetical protein HYV97_09510 [Bdellovibrio sp.]|nr:hypothetical protein [Bdellovibrio sp.]
MYFWPLLLFIAQSLMFCPKVIAAERVSDLIRCLGQEELALHKKKLDGPIYQLNQELIVLFAGNNELILKDGFYEEICQHKDFPPSVALLRKLLANNYNIFILDEKLVPARTKLNQHVILNELKDRGHLIFANYIASLQGLTKDPHCLEREIPELKYLYERIKYLEEEIDAQELVGQNDKIEAVFEKLKNFKALQKRCEDYLMNSKKKAEKKSKR